MRTRLTWCVLVALLFAVTSVSAADGKASREQMQVKRLQQLQRKLQQENTQLAQEKAALDGQLKAVQSSLEESSSKAQIAASRAAALGKELKEIKAEKEALAAELAETKEALNKSALAGRQLDADLKQKNESLAICQAKNAKLHGYGVDLLDKYEKKGCGDALLQADPFTQLKRVEIENLMEDYREKLDEQKLDEKKMDQAPR